jgi:uncharacterized protein YdaU (DUF1376 family)
VNFIEWHIGDWIKHTRKLALIERAIYHELLMAYYTQEGPFPNAQDAYATINPEGLTRALRDATDKVLARMFVLVEGAGYTNKRADEEIYRYQQKQPAAENKRKNDRERQERARDRRAALFAQLRAHGITAPYDATTAQLEQSLARLEREHRPPVTGHVTAPVTRDNTATSPQSPTPSNTDTKHSVGDDSTLPGTHAELDRKAREAAEAMKAQGMTDTDASDVRLRAMVQQGMSKEELASAAAAAVKAGKGWPWALARAKNRRQDAAALVIQPGQEQPSISWQDSREGVEAMGERVGLGRWKQFDSESGQHDPWPAYRSRVLAKASEHEGSECSTST